MMGSGWPSGHIAIDWYHSYPDKPGGNESILTDDTQNAEELVREIDLLIEELQELRQAAPQAFDRWNKVKR